MSACAWITHPDCRLHEMGPDHPECPDRLDAIADHFISTGLMQLLVSYEAPEATDEQLARAHSMRHVRGISSLLPADGYVHLDPDTLANAHSARAARRAAGAAVLATDLVLRGEAATAFCAVRPPGHHATRDAAMGFCLFNNVAVGIRHALDAHGLERVALVDFDVHHGNGSEDIFAGDGRVLMLSTFQRGIYPFSGEQPLGPNMVNVPLPPGATGEALEAAFHRHWKPRLDAFRPQAIYVSAGFDAHRLDDMGGLLLIEEDYAWITQRIVAAAAEHCGGRVVSCLEGGYDTGALARSAAAHVRVLAGADRGLLDQRQRAAGAAA